MQNNFSYPKNLIFHCKNIELERILTVSVAENYIILFKCLHKWKKIVDFVFEYGRKEKLH